MNRVTEADLDGALAIDPKESLSFEGFVSYLYNAVRRNMKKLDQFISQFFGESVSELSFTGKL